MKGTSWRFLEQGPAPQKSGVLLCSAAHVNLTYKTFLVKVSRDGLEGKNTTTSARVCVCVDWLCKPTSGRRKI